MNENQTAWEIFREVHKELDKAEEPEPLPESPPPVKGRVWVGRIWKRPSNTWRRKNIPMLPGEIPLVQWLAEKAKSLSITPQRARDRLRRGDFPGVKVRRVSPKIAFVTPHVPDYQSLK